MNPVNATTLYLSACRSTFKCDPQDPETYSELFTVLPFFRDSLSCRVCDHLLQNPVSPANSSCLHYVCKDCRGKRMLLKRACSWCKDFERFEENKQLSILVECYRKLCEYISASLSVEQAASTVRGYPEVMRMLQEVLDLKEKPEGLCNADTSNVTQNQALSTSESHSVSWLKTVTDPPQCSSNKSSNDIDILSVDKVTVCAPSSLDTVVDLEPPRSEMAPVHEPLTVEEFYSDTVAIKVLNDNSKTEKENGSKAVCAQEVLETPDTLQHKSEASGRQDRTLAVPSQQFSHPQNSESLPSNHPQQPSTGITAATHRKVRLSRKRSRSESDSETVQPLPLTCFIQGPPVAATAPPKVACEPNPPAQPAAAVPNGGVLKVNKALLDSCKNIQKSVDTHSSKKGHAKSKPSVAKPKVKTKSRVIAGGETPGQPPKTVYKKSQEKKGCKCGRATQNPSVLTCRGQRCPCYSNRKACLDCICRGCQNSYMANGEKKLEAFAVPEKALEQTRLTLGINVTSISVRNAGANAGVLSLTTGSPMASFLDTSPHEDQNFEDSLEMQFDC
ncbi:E3 ubiquitin-protein ligase MSL2a [Chanos chanos]|uniref:E3 ubiquitin-protein ligase MSL2 n=1 Tax=Chanos chanos TaxID=29144 RepID=A0A6J2V9M7_CHACN|nr:E3 ubiquitin-protein ligase MSL2-like [Chanos chanos]